MHQPAIRYVAGEDDVHVAYQVVGTGEIGVVLGLEPPASLHAVWDESWTARFLRRLSSFAKVVLFDRRGYGASDPLPWSDPRPVEQLIDDLRRVIDAAGLERAVLVGTQDGAHIALQMAATFPQRVSHLVLINAFARLAQSEDYPIGVPLRVQHVMSDFGRFGWGEAVGIEQVAPRRASDDEFRDWYSRAMRQGQSPATAQANLRRLFEIDVRSVLPAVSVPTLVIHSSENTFVRPAHGRFIADNISGARWIELSGGDHALPAMDLDCVADEIENFVLGAAVGRDHDRRFAAILISDLVGSTEAAVRHGDSTWHALLDQHDELAVRQIARFSGRLVKTTGDGVLAIFDGPARAIRCALALREGVARLGLEMRAGLHAGEVEVRDDDVAGVAVHIAARIEALATPGEVLVSRTLVDLVAGSGIEFVDRGEHELKGVPVPWRLFAVAAR